MPSRKNQDHDGDREYARLSGYVKLEDKLRWDEAVDHIRQLENRRELSNGEMFIRCLEDGLPTAHARKKQDPPQVERGPSRIRASS